jgi:hypothetical protein
LKEAEISVRPHFMRSSWANFIILLIRTNMGRGTPKHSERFEKFTVSNIIQTCLELRPNLDFAGGAPFAGAHSRFWAPFVVVGGPAKQQ